MQKVARQEGFWYKFFHLPNVHLESHKALVTVNSVRFDGQDIHLPSAKSKAYRNKENSLASQFLEIVAVRSLFQLYSQSDS